MSERRIEAYSVRKFKNSAFFHYFLNTIQKSARHEFVTIFNTKCIFSVNQGGLRPLTFLPRILRWGKISEIVQKPGQPGSA